MYKIAFVKNFIVHFFSYAQSKQCNNKQMLNSPKKHVSGSQKDMGYRAVPFIIRDMLVIISR